MTAPNWQGINHLALVTDDMDATTRFWHGVLGAELVATLGNESFRHYFFRIGDGQTVAFFEYTDAAIDQFAKPSGVPYRKAGQFDHVSLNLPTLEDVEDLRRRLKEFDCEVTEVVDHGFIKSIYFTDPTGIALEASCWTAQLGASAFHDRDPVAAVDEIVATGRVNHTPETRLVDGIVDPVG